MRVRFSFAGLSSDNSRHGPAQTVQATNVRLTHSLPTFALGLDCSLFIGDLQDLKSEFSALNLHSF